MVGGVDGCGIEGVSLSGRKRLMYERYLLMSRTILAVLPKVTRGIPLQRCTVRVNGRYLCVGGSCGRVGVGPQACSSDQSVLPI